MPEHATRIRAALNRKGADAGRYWLAHGVARFTRELRADGLTPQEIVDVLGPIADEMADRIVAETIKAALVSDRRPPDVESHTR